MSIVVLCETMNRYRFFRRFASVMSNRGERLIVLSNRLSIIVAARRDGFVAKLVKGTAFTERGQSSILNYCDSYEVENGLMTLEDFKKGLGGIESFLKKFLELFPVDLFFFWNGSSFVARAMGAYVKKRGINTLYFEIGNFPGKLFVDPDGVNIRSRFAACYREMDKHDVHMVSFEGWVHNFLEGKRRLHRVLQARVSTGFNWSYPIDMAGFYFSSAPWSERPRVFRRTFNYLFSRLIRYDFDEFDPEERPFFFFPLQVSTDSQILWNSSISIIDALRTAAAMAVEADVILAVKPHPAEIDRLFVKRLAQLREELGFVFVNNNTFDLIRKSEKVITINSTVGLETMLCGKKLTCLGQPMYENFTREDLAFYVQSYLIDIDFFDDQPLTGEQYDAILARLNC